MTPLEYVRGLNPRLPRSVQVLQAGGLVNALGNGLVLPFLFIYLNDVRGIPKPTCGLILATNSLVALVAGPVTGTLAERFGARATVRFALVVAAVGYGSYAFVHEAWQAFLCATATGIANGAFWPSQAALIARLTPPEQSHTAWSMQRVMMNTGVGLGGLLGGFLATGSHASGYQLIFALDAATFLVYLGVLRFVPDARGSRSQRAGTYREVLRNHALVGIMLVNAVWVTAGIAMFELLPAYAKHEAGLTSHMIGFVFLANTLFIGLAQLPVAQLLEGRRRMPALLGMLVLGGLAWMAIPLVTFLSPVEAALAVSLLAVVFGFAECLHGAVQAPVVVDLSEPRLLERTMALSGSSWTLGFILGPAIGGLMLAEWPAGLWIGAGAVLILTSLAALPLERRLPERALRTPRRERAVAELAATEALG